jgi:hypothetical protein
LLLAEILHQRIPGLHRVDHLDTCSSDTHGTRPRFFSCFTCCSLFTCSGSGDVSDVCHALACGHWPTTRLVRLFWRHALNNVLDIWLDEFMPGIHRSKESIRHWQHCRGCTTAVVWGRLCLRCSCLMHAFFSKSRAFQLSSRTFIGRQLLTHLRHAASWQSASRCTTIGLLQMCTSANSPLARLLHHSACRSVASQLACDFSLKVHLSDTMSF